MATNQNTVVTPVVSTTGTLKREVAEQIRSLNPILAPTLSMTSDLSVDKNGNYVRGKALISKKTSPNMKFEWFTFTPITLSYKATAGGSNTFTVADVTAFIVRDQVVNLRTYEVGIITAIDTGTGAVTVQAVTSAFTAAADDYIILMANVQEEGSSTATSRTKEPDNNWNTLMIARYPIEVADTAKNSPHFGGDIMSRYKKQNMDFALRTIENQLIMGERAVSGETTAATITTALNFYTSRGAWKFSQATFDAEGAMTIERWQQVLFTQLPESIDPTSGLIMYCGRPIYSELQEWASKDLITMESGEKDVYGINVKKFYCGSIPIEVRTHWLFDQGQMRQRALIFEPSDFVHRFKEGLDLQPKNGIQNPAAMSQKDELRGTFGLQCWSGGANVIKVLNWATGVE